MGSAPPTPSRYQAFFCEENVWWLARAPELKDRRRWAAFVSNPERSCAMWCQKAAPPGQAVLWDYHVVLLVEAGESVEVWDLDCRAGLPLPLGSWVEQTFRAGVPEQLAPRFRVVSALQLEQLFASDRRHMRDEHGQWRAEPPGWPPIVARSGAVHTLDAFVDTLSPGLGEVMSLEQLQGWAARPSARRT